MMESSNDNENETLINLEKLCQESVQASLTFNTDYNQQELTKVEIVEHFDNNQNFSDENLNKTYNNKEIVENNEISSIDEITSMEKELHSNDADRYKSNKNILLKVENSIDVTENLIDENNLDNYTSIKSNIALNNTQIKDENINNVQEEENCQSFNAVENESIVEDKNDSNQIELEEKILDTNTFGSSSQNHVIEVENEKIESISKIESQNIESINYSERFGIDEINEVQNSSSLSQEISEAIIDTKEMINYENSLVIKPEANSLKDTTNLNVSKGVDSKTNGSVKVPKLQECIVCKRVVKCKYNIVRNGDTKHLCEDNCFKIFRAKPTTFLHSSTGIDGGGDAAFNGTTPVLCEHCQSLITQSSSLLLKIKDVEYKFCKKACQDAFKRSLKICTMCKKDLRADLNAFLAPITGEGFRDFCGTKCLADYELSINRKNAIEKNSMSKSNNNSCINNKSSGSKSVAPPTMSECSVCSKMACIKHEVNFGSQIHRLCSDICFASFQVANNLSSVNALRCENCRASLPPEELAGPGLQFEGFVRRFCGQTCSNTFRAKKQKNVACNWCGKKKCNFDMVERLDADKKLQMFCSLECLSLYRVNLQANSDSSVPCDQCNKQAPAQYHLTMSDATVRNFCRYGCVTAFQSKFSKLDSSISGKVPPNSKNVGQLTTDGKITPSSINKVGVGNRNNNGKGKDIHIISKTVKTTANKHSEINTLNAPELVVTSNKSKYGTRQASRGGRAIKYHKDNDSDYIYPDDDRNNAIIALDGKNSTGTFGTILGSITEVNNNNIGVISGNIKCPEIIVRLPPPKQVKNKSMLCKPYMQTKATSCRPQCVNSSTQTEEFLDHKNILVPCPIPIFIPAPTHLYTTPTPYPTLLPFPLPVPCFIPTSKKTGVRIMKKIKHLQDSTPSDPFEAEMLLMAQAVANDGRHSSSDDDDDYIEGEEIEDRGYAMGEYGNEESVMSYAGAGNGKVLQYNNVSSQNGNGLVLTRDGRNNEDMLQIALRMASEITAQEPSMDMEDNLAVAPIRPKDIHQPLSLAQVQYGSSQETDANGQYITGMQRQQRGGKRKGTRGASVGALRNANKKTKIDDVTVSNQENISNSTAPTTGIYQLSQPEPPPLPSDATFVLKFTYGVNAYRHWVTQKNSQIEAKLSGSLRTPFATPRGPRLFKLDILKATTDELNFALSLFVKEVRKPNGEEYAPDSIFYLCLGIQEYLYENGRVDNIFTDFYFERFTTNLNEVLNKYEVRLNAQGMLVCRIEEEHLWESKQLGAHSPHVLLNTLVYFNTKHFMLKTPQEHLSLSFSQIMKHWKKTTTPSGKQGRAVYLRFYSPTATGINSDVRKRTKEEMPVFEQAENADNPLRCPVKLYEFYLSKCPESIKNRNDVFYLIPERSCVPDSPVWYSTQAQDIPGMSRMINRLRVVREIQEAQLSNMSPFYN